MQRRGIRVLGILFLVVGAVFILSGFPGFTGFAIFDTSAITHSISFYLGLIFLVIGAILAWQTVEDVAEDTAISMQGTQKMWEGKRKKVIIRESSRGPNAVRNAEVRNTYREMFRQEYGRYPSQKELHEYKRADHESGRIEEVVKENYPRR